VRRRALLVAGVFAAIAPAAHAYRLNEITPQPRLLYYVGLKDWRKPMARVVRALNRAHVGVRLVRAQIPEQASIQVGRLKKRCGLAGEQATTLTIEGGYAAIYLPYGCHGAAASVIAAHELGHALGLAHEDRRCALMNSSGTGRRSIPTNCLGRRYPWRRKPFRADDLAGLRRLYRDTRPHVTIELTGPATVRANTSVRFAIGLEDREHNLSQYTVDYGDGVREEHDASEAPPASHAYTAPGTYRIRVTGVDFYRKRDSASVTVMVTG
jgi:hypothetical protein